jgi:hypothetical protein
MKADQNAHWFNPLTFLAWWVLITGVFIGYVSVAYPQPDPIQFTVIRLLFALLAASLASILPGFMHVAAHKWVTAAGALAVFIIVYFLSPARLVTSTPPKEIVVSYTVCSGEYERNCNFPHESYLYCYVDPASWAKNVCSSYTITQLGSYGGNKCGYTRYEVLCRKQAPL